MMISLLNILVIVVFGVMIVMSLSVIKYILLFYRKLCKHCGHTMLFRGEKKEDDKDTFLFQCPHCKEWEEIPANEFNELYDINGNF